MPLVDAKERKRYQEKYRKTVKGKAAHARSEKKYAEKLRLIVVRHYCKNKIRCQCPGCHTSAVCFLQVDHIDGKGYTHRIGKYRVVSKALWLWIIKNNFPDGFQILCSNCNHAKKCKLTCPMVGRKH